MTRLWYPRMLLRERVERLTMALAWAMPRRLAYWCAVRVGAQATTGPWSDQVVPDLRFMDALQRWDARR